MDVGRASRFGSIRGRKVRGRRDKKRFSRTASRTRRENVVTIMRGGTRL